MERLAERQQSVEEADREFHQIIGRATRNSAMEAAVDQLWAFRARMPMWGKLHELIGEIKKHRDWNDDLSAVTDHRAIIEAFETRDPDKARAAMQAHLRRVNDVLMTASELDLIPLDDRQFNDGAAPAARSSAMSTELLVHEDRLFPADPGVRALARELYAGVKDLPLISPHGHTNPAWFAENEPFPDPATLFIQPDHYLFRMLYSQGYRLEDLGIPRLDGGPVETDTRKIWRIFADNYYLFRGTPSRMWVRP